MKTLFLVTILVATTIFTQTARAEHADCVLSTRSDSKVIFYNNTNGEQATMEYNDLDYYILQSEDKQYYAVAQFENDAATPEAPSKAVIRVQNLQGEVLGLASAEVPKRLQAPVHVNLIVRYDGKDAKLVFDCTPGH
jgi:hypothetical protein